MRIDVYHHSIEARCEVMRRLDALDDKIDLVMETIMATLEELNAALATISTRYLPIPKTCSLN
jgi:hypothetical protein